MDSCQQFATEVPLSECINNLSRQLNFITVFVLLLVNLLLKQEFEKKDFELYCPSKREMGSNN